jgi:anaerobic selenocysteine-containing dehydrogenase
MQKTHSVPRGIPNGEQVSPRRDFLRQGPLLGGACLAALQDLSAEGRGPAVAGIAPLTASDYIYTTCLQCNTGCEIKVRIQEGMAVKIDGNPYAPRTMDPHLPWDTPVEEAADLMGAICPKGQAGIQTHYDPYRIVKVLKRAGARGEGKWITISFDQAIDEIVEGGVLFPQDGGRTVTGLRELWALRDPQLFKDMAADVARIQSHEMTAAEFQEKYREHLHTLIDPDHPDFGPRNNQFVFNWGRLKAGRSDFFNRFVRSGFGSTNAHGHTTVCQGSIYFAGKAMSEQPSGGKFSGGAKAYWMADTSHAEFIIYWGANVLEGNYGPPLKAPKITRGLASGRLKIAVIDPRYTRIAAKAWKYLTVKPGQDAALALGMIRWILEDAAFDARYLANCNRAAAMAAGEPTWTNAAWLVKIRPDGTTGAFLRAPEIGLGGDSDTFVCLRDGQPTAFKSPDTATAVTGDLFVDTELQGIRVKSSLQILWEEASRRTVRGWAELAGVREEDVVELAREFTSHGKRAVVEIHRGVSQHTNGFYNVLATMGTLNLLIGNLDWQGGLVYGAGSYGETGGSGRPFQLAEQPGGVSPFGIDIIRGGASYEKSTIFEGYPARRPWYPLSSDVYQEVIPSLGDAYPYPIKILLLYMGSPVYALPAGHSLVETLTDLDKLPLFIASDIVIGETSMFADYIFPDLSYLERWEFHRTHPSIVHRVSPVRQPAVNSPNETVEVYGERMPLSMEAVFLAFAERLGIPGFGPGGFGAGDLTRPEDFYLRMVANIAFGDKADGSDIAPDASPEEMEVFLQARRHLSPEVFDPERWQAVVGPQWWPKVVYVLNRGGRWWGYDEAWAGGQVKAKYGKLVNLYHEKAATTRNSMTGAYLKGTAAYLPVADSLGRPLEQAAPPPPGVDPSAGLRLVTGRSMLATKSRTISNYWLTDIQPENTIWLNKLDARRLGLRPGQRVRIVSASNPAGRWDLGPTEPKPLEGQVQISYHLSPGVVSFDLGFGHWAYGARDQIIDGEVLPGDPRRGTGIHANAAMYVDRYLRSPLSDVVGGSAVFYDSTVYLLKI